MHRILYLPLLLLVGCASDRREEIPDEVFAAPVLINSPETDKQLFVWDFSSPKTYVYQILNETTSTISTGADGPGLDMEVGMEMVQELLVQTEGQQEAEVLMASMEIIEITGIPGMESLAQNSIDVEYPRSMGRIRADGVAIDANKSGLNYFILPGRDLKPGEQDTIQSEYMVDSLNTSFGIRHSTVITFVGFEEYEGRNCAVLVANQLSEDGYLQVNEEDLSMNADLSMAGGSRYYFDVEGHYFVGAEIISDGAVDGFDSSSFGGGGQDGMDIGVSVRSIQKVRLLEIRPQ